MSKPPKPPDVVVYVDGSHVVEARRPDGTPVVVAPACRHGNVAGIDCGRCRDAELVAVHVEWERRCKAVDAEGRDEITSLRAEVARLEALIVRTYISWFDADDQYSDEVLAFCAEVARIRGRS